MFDLITKNKRLVQIILVLIAVPFAFFGVDVYFRFTDTDRFIAEVGRQKISQQEFGQVLRDRQETMQRLLGGRADPALLDNPELRLGVLEGLVRQRLLLSRAAQLDLAVPDSQLQAAIAGLPAFQQDGKFSDARYEQFLRAQGKTPLGFEAEVRQDLMIRRLTEAYADTALASMSVAERLLRASEQRREVSHYTLTAGQFAPQVKLEADAAQKYYDNHREEFQTPEQVRLEYIVLTLDHVAAQIRVSPEELKKYYDDPGRAAQFRVPEQRQASHILVSVDAGAAAEAKQAARAKAERIHKQLAQNPGKFAEFAKQYSQDPGSAAHGGDLGFIARGAMKDLKGFEDALFGMKPGEISAPVESQYGFHIIRLTAVQPGKTTSFEEARGQIESELRKQLAGRKFAEVAENLSNIVFEQADSLKPAAELLKTGIQTSGWLSRRGAEEKLLNNEKLLQAVFSEDVLRNKRNTEMIEIAPNTLIAARVAQHKPAAVRPFGEVSGEIAKKLAAQQAAQLAAKDGRARLEKLRQGRDAGVKWGPAELVSRADPRGVPEAVLRQVFKLDVTKLPAYVGVEDAESGYTLVKVSRVVEAQEIGREETQAFAQQLRQLLGQEEFAAYVASLMLKADVKLRLDLIEKR